MNPTTRVNRTRLTETVIAAALLAGALGGWWWSVRMAAMAAMAEMASMPMQASMSLTAYLIGWIAMMAAMMFPAIYPVVRPYSRASGRGTVAPLPFFVGGYMLVWGALGLPAYVAWRTLAGPIDAGAMWVGRLAGAVLLTAGLYQLTPLKRACFTDSNWIHYEFDWINQD